MTRSQKQAWYLLTFEVCVLLWFVLILIGIEWLTITIGLIGQGIVVFLVVRYLLARKKRGQPQTETDERDEMILGKVPKYLNIVILTILLVWLFVFMFGYDYDSEVPVKLVKWMIISIVFSNMLAYPVCTLIAYWRVNRHGK